MQLFIKKISKLNRLIILTLSFLATSQAMAFGCDNSFSPAIGNGTGDGASAATPIIIDSPAGLAALATCTNAGNTTSGFYYQLANDIDLSGYSNWTPIGSSTPFQGTFDGAGNTVSNLTINNSLTNYQGLFGLSSGATIENINLTNVNILVTMDSANAGALIGVTYNIGTTISNISVSGTVSSTGKSAYVGGIVGTTINSTITNSSNSATVSATGNAAFIGGITGYASYTAVTSGINSGTITGGDTAFVGGITGYTSYATVTSGINSGVITGGSTAIVGGIIGRFDVSTVTSSSNNGTINATNGSKIGGIIGAERLGSSLTTSYNTGIIGDGTLSNSYAGGLVGYMYNANSISESYNAGLVQAGSGNAVGALYGGNDGSTQTITDVYFDNSKSGAGSAVGVGLTTADMSQNASATTMPNFDFTSTWTTFTDDVYHYPQLIAFNTGTSDQKAYSLSSTRSILVPPPAIPAAIPSSGLLALLALIGLLIATTSYRFKRS